MKFFPLILLLILLNCFGKEDRRITWFGQSSYTCLGTFDSRTQQINGAILKGQTLNIIKLRNGNSKIMRNLKNDNDNDFAYTIISSNAFTSDSNNINLGSIIEPSDYGTKQYVNLLHSDKKLIIPYREPQHKYNDSEIIFLLGIVKTANSKLQYSINNGEDWDYLFKLSKEFPEDEFYLLKIK